MPRYFFHVQDGETFPDLQGTELPNLAAARKEALRFSSGLLADAGQSFWNGTEWSMTVTDEKGLTLFILNFIATDAPSISGS